MRDGLESGNSSPRTQTYFRWSFLPEIRLCCKPGKGGVGRVGLVCDTDCRPSLFPSSKKSHFRDEAKWETFVVKMSFFAS